MQELGESRGVWRSPWVLGDTHLRGVLVGRRGHRLGGHHRQSRCRGDMVHPGWDSHREPVGGRNSAGLRGISPWKEIPWKRRKKGTERRGDKHPSTVLHHPVPGRNPRWFDDPYHNLVIIWDLWFWIKECIRAQAKGGDGKIFPGQQPGKGRVLGDDGCHRQTSLYLPPWEPWCTQAIFFPPLMPITTVPKWGFPSLFQLFLLFGSRKTSHKCKTFHFLQLYSKKNLSLCLWPPWSHILKHCMLNPEGTLSIQCWVDRCSWLLHCVGQPSWLLCWVGRPHGDWMDRKEEREFKPLLDLNSDFDIPYGHPYGTQKAVWDMPPQTLLKLLCFL